MLQTQPLTTTVHSVEHCGTYLISDHGRKNAGLSTANDIHFCQFEYAIYRYMYYKLYTRVCRMGDLASGVVGLKFIISELVSVVESVSKDIDSVDREVAKLDTECKEACQDLVNTKALTLTIIKPVKDLETYSSDEERMRTIRSEIKDQESNELNGYIVQIKRCLDQAENVYSQFMQSCEKSSKSCARSASSCKINAGIAKRRKDFAKTGGRYTNIVFAFCFFIVVVGIALKQMAASGTAATNSMLYICSLGVVAFLVGLSIWYVITSGLQYAASQYEQGQKAFEKLQLDFDVAHRSLSKWHDRFYQLKLKLEHISAKITDVEQSRDSSGARRTDALLSAFDVLQYHLTDLGAQATRRRKPAQAETQMVKNVNKDTSED